ncbi:hypothetical protein [Aquimarina sp. 2201CG14-23]|uniref:hypothetical protein n=1 Tax=Aquimarina mycalae TaxID=3040073 RepID=UPI00247824AA|nr:hypothetical protein [Aquimarina sp. 2201CG14-23]MDH7444519.1 hypothetical protein [Aquimarina sp. 2201CG14-23]
MIGHSAYNNAVREALERLPYNNIDEAAKEVAEFQNLLQLHIGMRAGDPTFNLGSFDLLDVINNYKL